MHLRPQITFPALVFIILVAFGWIGFGFQYTQELELQRSRNGFIARQICNRLQNNIDHQLEALVTFAALLPKENGISPSPFLTEMRTRLRPFRSLTILDTNGRVQWHETIADRDTIGGSSDIGWLGTPKHDEPTFSPPRVHADGHYYSNLHLPFSTYDQESRILRTRVDIATLVSQCCRDGVDEHFHWRVSINGLPVIWSMEVPSLPDKTVWSRYTFQLGGQEWAVAISMMEAFAAGEVISPLSPMPIIGTLLAILFAFFTRLIILRREQAQRSRNLLLNSEAKFRSIFENSPLGMIRFDEQGEITDWNQNAIDLFGSEILKNQHSLQSMAERIPELQEVVGKVLAGQKGDFDGKLVLDNALDPLYLRGVFVPLFTVNRQLTGGIGVLEEITSQKRAERLKQVLYTIADMTSRVEKLDELYEGIQLSLSEVLDTENFYIALYDQTNQSLSYPYYRDEFDTQPTSGPLHRGLTEYVLEHGQPLLVSKREILEMAEQGLISIEGTPSEQWLGSPLIIGNEVIGVLAVQSYQGKTTYTDEDLEVLNFVSDQIARTIRSQSNKLKLVESEGRYRQLSQELAESNNMKELLLDVMTHDLKNPAGVIASVTELLSESEDHREEIQLIHDSTDSLLQVIENASTLAQVTLGEEIERAPFDLTAFLDRTAIEFQPLFAAAGKSLTLNIARDLTIHANQIFTETVVNFLSNAVKYASPEDQVELAAGEKDNEVWIEVRDHGTTIPESNREAIFERRVQLAGGKRRGRGLGLAIVKRIVKAHGGRFGVRPNEPQGNIFYITIPMNT